MTPPLHAVIFNCTLKREPRESNTEVLCEKAEATFDRLLLVRGGQNRACDSHPQEV
jgi:hypothetical protein